MGYKDALSEAAIEIDNSFQIYTDFKDRGGYDGVKKLLSLTNPPDAIFTTNNRMTAGAFQALKELKVQVPEKVGLIGFDEIPWGDIVTPSISTVSQPTRQMGMAAAKKLLSRLNSENVAVEEILFQPELVIRESSRR